MNKTKVAKTVVNLMTNLVVGGATSGVLRTYTKRSANPIVNLVLNASVFVGAAAVSGTLMEPVTKHIDQEVDKIAASLSNLMN